ncbi:MAG: XRE family transcriptional regulator [Betaproteobacteria bacterium]|nr:XRE family transcriptional regulator [Betaproteobacteria bacterium]
MSQVQVIEKDGKPVFYVLPAALWERVREAVEDAEDAAAYDLARATDDGVRFPADVARSIANGTSPLKAWREYRQMTLQALADLAGVSKPFVSQIESGKRTGSAATLSRLAKSLDIPLAALLV